jgi:hypothetical protein
MMEVWRVVAGRISFRKIHEAIVSLTLKEKLASQCEFEPYSKSTASHEDATYLICV